MQSGTLVDLLEQRAGTVGNAAAYTFIVDGSRDIRSVTWAELHTRASALGSRLQAGGAAGHPVLLALGSGLAFVESLFACWYAGAIAVPVSLPRHARVKHRLDLIVEDAGARFAVGSPLTRERLEGDGVTASCPSGMMWFDPEGAATVPLLPRAHAKPTHVALLQYTSGSTGAPRGVIVTHDNLLENSALIAEACGHVPTDTLGGWLPLFHDMGLIGIVIQAAYVGSHCVLMAPERFLMRPWQWLQMLSDYKICSSPAPNFAYELCVEKVTDEQKRSLDLSHWRNALNGSEPVRAATMNRFADAFASCGFRREAIFPCYGLAESTLFVTGPGASRHLTQRKTAGEKVLDAQTAGHVGCGRVFGDTRVAIVDPDTLRRRTGNEIGEIWVAGASVAAGYWNNAEATEKMFAAKIADPLSEGDAATRWLRTGDLGRIVDGELFITGRLKEMVIVAGRNFFPVDIERTAEAADSAIAATGAAAFSVEIGGIERLIVVLEARRDLRATADAPSAAAICSRVKAAIAAGHEVTPHEVVFLRSGGLARTTSGKLSRVGTRAAYINSTLERWESTAHAHAGV